MDEAKIREGVQEILAGNLGLTNPKPGDGVTLAELGVDSLDCVEIVMEIEEDFDVAITDVEMEKAKTVGDIVRLVKEKLA